MELQFALSGSVIFTTDADCIPEAGASVVFRTQSYKKGIEAGTLVGAVVDREHTNEYDFTGEKLVVRIAVNPVTPIDDQLPE